MQGPGSTHTMSMLDPCRVQLMPTLCPSLDRHRLQVWTHTVFRLDMHTLCPSLDPHRLQVGPTPCPGWTHTMSRLDPHRMQLRPTPFPGLDLCRVQVWTLVGSRFGRMWGPGLDPCRVQVLIHVGFRFGSCRVQVCTHVGSKLVPM